MTDPSGREGERPAEMERLLTSPIATPSGTNAIELASKVSASHAAGHCAEALLALASVVRANRSFSS